MIKRKYYYLVAGLPDIIPDDKKLTFSSVQLRTYLKENLHPSDHKLVKLLYFPWDHDNLIKLLFNDEFEWDARGNYPKEKLEQLADKKQFDLLETDTFPAYMTEIARKFHNDEENLSKPEAVNKLTRGWYQLLLSSDILFIKEYARFKLNLTNIILALNGRKHGIHYEDSLIGEDEVAAALKKNKARDFGLSNEIAYLENLVQIFETDNILDREMKLDKLVWNFLNDITFFNYFTIERILAFVLKLFIAERWYLLDKEKGQQIFKQLLDELHSDFKFPEEFAITYGKRKQNYR